MNKKKKPHSAPLWLRRSLLGVCFWVGHRRALFRRHPLAEAALVAELCNLISANIDDNLFISCEVPYSKILNISDEGSEFSEGSRIDLCIHTKLARGTKYPNFKTCKFLIEVKRGVSTQSRIQADLRRLREVKAAHPELRTFLLIICERGRPKPYIGSNGLGSKRPCPIKGDRVYEGRVITALKAIPMLKDLDTAHYACAIEVRKKARKIQ